MSTFDDVATATPQKSTYLQQVCIGTPGIAQELKFLILEGIEAEKRGNLTVAIKNYRNALYLIPEDERLKAKVKRLYELTGDTNSLTVLEGKNSGEEDDLAELLFKSVNGKLNFRTPYMNKIKKANQMKPTRLFENNERNVTLPHKFDRQLSLSNSDEENMKSSTRNKGTTKPHDKSNCTLKVHDNIEDALIPFIKNEENKEFTIFTEHHMPQFEEKLSIDNNSHSDVDHSIIGDLPDTSEMKHILEKQIIDILNEANLEQLMTLHNIGKKRAALIIETRNISPFRELADLKKVGLHGKQIIKTAEKHAIAALHFP